MALFTLVTDPSGATRLYFTRLGTVVSYLESAGEAGLRAVVEPGALAFPSTYDQAQAGVREAMIEELARRLGVCPKTVLAMPMTDAAKIADAPLAETNPWQGRSRGRGRRK